MIAFNLPTEWKRKKNTITDLINSFIEKDHSISNFFDMYVSSENKWKQDNTNSVSQRVEDMRDAGKGLTEHII